MDVIKWTSGIVWILRQNYHFMMMVMMMMTAVPWSQKGLIDWLIEMEFLECGNDTFYGGGKLEKTPWAGLRIATNWTHDIMNSRTENQTCTIVKVVSRDIAKPQLLAQFSG